MVHHNKLDSEERKSYLTPRETLIRLGFEKGRCLADIGCGTGLFALPAAEIAGDTARIFALDISREMLDEVERRAAAAGVRSIQTVKSEPYRFPLADRTADFVLICTVLHEISDQARFLNEVERICKGGGTVAVIEFTEGYKGYGPPIGHRMSGTRVEKLLVQAGFQNVERHEIGAHFYAITGKKGGGDSTYFDRV